MKLKDKISLVDHQSAKDINWHQMEAAEIATEIECGEDTYYLLLDISGGHAVYAEVGSGGEDMYYSSVLDVGCSDIPKKVYAWLDLSATD